MGLSSSTATSSQSFSSTVTQQFSGACNIQCQNADKNTALTFVNSNVGNIDISQTCATDASCMIASANDSTVDVLFKAANSTNAKSASTVSWLDPGQIDTSNISSRQNISMMTNQAVNQTCNIGSYNELDNTSIFAANSNLGNITISQKGDTTGQCALSNSMSAADKASGDLDNNAQSGGKGKGQILMVIVVGVLLIAMMGILAKVMGGQSQSRAMKKAQKKALQAEALVGCPGGTKPVLDRKTKLPILNPKTGKPICPPPPPGSLRSTVGRGVGQSQGGSAPPFGRPSGGLQFAGGRQGGSAPAAMLR